MTDPDVQPAIVAELAAINPRIRPRCSWTLGELEGLELAISQQPDDELRDALTRVLGHPSTRSVRRLDLGASYPSQPDVDFRWVIDTIDERLRPPSLEHVTISGARLVTYDGAAPLWAGLRSLSSMCRTTSYRGTFATISTLELRNDFVDWPGSTWPELETLVLRPEGNPTRGIAWARLVLAAAGSFPKLCELRFAWLHGDALLEILLAAPLLGQLKRLDLTDNITNRGAQLLYTSADKVAHLEEIWIGSTGARRHAAEETPGVDHPKGTLEIDDRWSSRLRARLGKQVRFKPRGQP